MNEPNLIPPGHGERAGQAVMPRCPHCATVIDLYLAAATGAGHGRCPTHGPVKATYAPILDAAFACKPDESAGQT